MIHGTVYRDVPDYPYELIFNDSLSQDFDNEHVMCNMQIIKIVEKSDIPVTALACSLIFGPQKDTYFKNWSLGLVNHVSRHDMIL